MASSLLFCNYEHAFCREPSSLHHDGEIHATVNRAVEVVNSRCSEGANFGGAAIDVEIADGWRSWLAGGFGGVTRMPTPTLDNVVELAVIGEFELRYFRNVQN